MGDKIVKSKNLCCQPVVFPSLSLLNGTYLEKFLKFLMQLLIPNTRDQNLPSEGFARDFMLRYFFCPSLLMFETLQPQQPYEKS